MSKRPAEWVDHYVYRTWDASGRLLYVGCSLNVEHRIHREHRYSAPWYPRMVRSTVDGPYSYSVARSVEREATRTEGPLYNGFTGRSVTERKARSNFFDSVMYAALNAGESLDAAMKQAGIATEIELPSCNCWERVEGECPVHDELAATA